jgi:AcrR family transcriptional regulator
LATDRHQVNGEPEQQLPRGRHGLPPDQVAENHRRRILRAAGQTLLDRDSCSLTVADICRAAGVSSATFYQQFEDKGDCLAAAHDLALETLLELLEGACEGQPSWPQNVFEALEAAFAWVAASPSAAAPLLIGPGIFNPLFDRRLEGANQRLAAMLADSARRAGAEAAPVEGVDQALIAGVAWALASRLRRGEGHSIPSSAFALARLLVMPYLGGGSEDDSQISKTRRVP